MASVGWIKNLHVFRWPYFETLYFIHVLKGRLVPDLNDTNVERQAPDREMGRKYTCSIPVIPK
jgi:hypothetical protein